MAIDELEQDSGVRCLRGSRDGHRRRVPRPIGIVAAGVLAMVASGCVAEGDQDADSVVVDESFGDESTEEDAELDGATEDGNGDPVLEEPTSNGGDDAPDVELHFDVTDHEGYEFDGELSVTLDGAETHIADSPPGEAKVAYSITVDGVVRNATEGRNYELLAPWLTVWSDEPRRQLRQGGEPVEPECLGEGFYEDEDSRPRVSNGSFCDEFGEVPLDSVTLPPDGSRNLNASQTFRREYTEDHAEHVVQLVDQGAIAGYSLRFPKAYDGREHLVILYDSEGAEITRCGYWDGFGNCE